jgi:hypothetical protein
METKLTDMAKRRAKMGRPRKRAAERRSVQLCVAMTPGEARGLLEAARKAGLTRSELVMRPWRETEKGGKP